MTATPGTAPRLPDEIRDIAAAQIGALSEVAAGLSDTDLVAATGCAGWLAAHLLMHIRLDAAELMAGLADPTERAADRDFVSYWRDWPPAAGPVTYSGVKFIWASAVAYRDEDSLRLHLADTMGAARAAAASARPGRYRFQGHVMTAEDMLGMWTAEFALHHLDLIAHLPHLAEPAPGALAVTVRTLDGLLGPERPPGWDEVTYVRKGTGRVPLGQAERHLLGERAAAYPAFG